MIEKTPEITWGTCTLTQHLSNADFTAIKEVEKVVKNTVDDEDSEEAVITASCLKAQQELEDLLEKDTDKLSVPFICVLGMLQRITVTVPDKAQSRLLVLGSIITVLNSLQVVKRKEDEEDDLRLQVRTCNMPFMCRLIMIDITHMSEP